MDLPTRPDPAVDRTLDVPDRAARPNGGEPTAADVSSGSVPAAARRRRARPPAVNAISLILLVVGGAMEGYAVALALSDTADRQYSLVWAFLGAALVVTALGAARPALVGGGRGDRRARSLDCSRGCSASTASW